MGSTIQVLSGSPKHSRQRAQSLLETYGRERLSKGWFISVFAGEPAGISTKPTLVVHHFDIRVLLPPPHMKAPTVFIENCKEGLARLVCFALACLLAGPGIVQGQVVSRVTVDSNGIEGNLGGGGQPPAISADGRFVAYTSTASNLVAGDSNGLADLFIHDSLTGDTSLLSIGIGGQASNGEPYIADISADGRYVVFDSNATNIVAGDVNGKFDVFVVDGQTGAVECASVNAFGIPANGNSVRPKISADGRYVCFQSGATDIDFSDSNSYTDVYLFDRVTKTSERISVDSFGNEGNKYSRYADISADGRFVAFKSWASNLVPMDWNGYSDYFVRDRLLGTTEIVSVDSSGNQGSVQGGTYWEHAEPGISGDGRFVVFASGFENLVPGDTNKSTDVFLHDRLNSTTERVSVNSHGEESIPPIEYDLVFPKVSDDGRYVVFSSLASNLVPYDTNGVPDVFVRDRFKAVTELVSMSSEGDLGNWISTVGNITPDGRFVVFNSQASNLVPGDTNAANDVFVHDRMTGGPDVDLTNVVAGQTATLTIKGATPGGIVVLGASLLGQGVLPTAWGPLELNGVTAFFAYVMDGAGQLSTPVWLDPALLGLPLWVQGIDLTMDFPTSVWGGTIQ